MFVKVCVDSRRIEGTAHAFWEDWHPSTQLRHHSRQSCPFVDDFQGNPAASLAAFHGAHQRGCHRHLVKAAALTATLASRGLRFRRRLKTKRRQRKLAGTDVAEQPFGVDLGSDSTRLINRAAYGPAQILEARRRVADVLERNQAWPSNEEAVAAWTKHLKQLAALEWQEELRQASKRLTEWSASRLIEEGFTVFDLQARLSGLFFGKLCVQFSPSDGGQLLSCDFQRGELVIVSSRDPLSSRLKARVISVTELAITCAMDTPLAREGPWRLDRGPNAVSYARTIQGLESFRSPGWGQGQVRRLLVDPEPGVSNEAPELLLEFSDTRLNDSQRAAVSLVESRRVVLVQGPPGCGKTHAACALLKAARCRGPLLAVADSNVAVDQLLKGLLALGVHAVRFGSPASVTDDDLLGVTVDSLLSDLPEWSHCQERLLNLKCEVQTLKCRINTMDRELDAGMSEPVGEELLADSHTSHIGTSSDGFITWTDTTDAGTLALVERDAVRRLRLELAEQQLSHLKKQSTKMGKKLVADILRGAQVICTTATGCGSAAFAGQSFDLVLLDESSQITEPRALIALGKLSSHGRLVLVGDQRQLPPIVLSNKAQSKGLGISLFDRLLDYPTVDSAMLMMQYRMHPLLRLWPSEAFYGGRLLDGVTAEQRAPPPGFPWPAAGGVAFVEAAGPEEASQNRCSWLNREECRLVCVVVGHLLKSMAAECIGVISPYRGQVKLLHQCLPGRVEVRTVDGFQGREKLMVVISCVRCNREGKLGFLTDPRRLNVALTRAQKGLVVIGNRATLRHNQHWCKWFRFVDAHELTVQNVDPASV